MIYHITKDVVGFYKSPDFGKDSIPYILEYPVFKNELINFIINEVTYAEFFEHPNYHHFVSAFPELIEDLSQANIRAYLEKVYADKENITVNANRFFNGDNRVISKIINSDAGVAIPKFFFYVTEEEVAKKCVQAMLFGTGPTASLFVTTLNAMCVEAGLGSPGFTTSTTLEGALNTNLFRQPYLKNDPIRIISNHYWPSMPHAFLLVYSNYGYSEGFVQKNVRDIKQINLVSINTNLCTNLLSSMSEELRDIFETDKEFRDALFKQNIWWFGLYLNLYAFWKRGIKQTLTTYSQPASLYGYSSTYRTFCGEYDDQVLQFANEQQPVETYLVTSNFATTVVGYEQPKLARLAFETNKAIIPTSLAWVNVSCFIAAFSGNPTGFSGNPLTGGGWSSSNGDITMALKRAPELFEVFIKNGSIINGYFTIYELGDFYLASEGLAPIGYNPTATAMNFGTAPEIEKGYFRSKSFRRLFFSFLATIERWRTVPALRDAVENLFIEEDIDVSEDISAFGAHRFFANDLNDPDYRYWLLNNPGAVTLFAKSTATLANMKANLDVFNATINNPEALLALVQTNSAGASYATDVVLRPLLSAVSVETWKEAIGFDVSKTGSGFKPAFFWYKNFVRAIIESGSEDLKNLAFTNFGQFDPSTKFTEDFENLPEVLLDEGSYLWVRTANSGVSGIRGLCFTGSDGSTTHFDLFTTAVVTNTLTTGSPVLRSPISFTYHLYDNKPKGILKLEYFIF